MVLFLGSGFSRGATSVNGMKFQAAIELAKMIGTLGGFDSEDDLRYASERFIREKNPEVLVAHLKDLFSVKNVLAHQVAIAAAPWLRTYTTNYDLSFERAATEAGKRIRTLETSDFPHLNQGPMCLHLNGSIQNLSAETLNTSFKLSSSSYLSPDSFISSSWHYTFKRDLDFSAAIVFVGYSLYDIEIQKILYENPDLSAKTYFVTAPDITQRERFTLQQFGHVVPIGAENFSTMLSDYLENLEPAEEFTLNSIQKYQVNSSTVEARDVDVDRFLMYGDISDSLIDSATLSPTGAPILVRRSALDIAEKLLDSGQPLAIIADFGNGKSTFLRSLRTRLVQMGSPVFTVEYDDEYNHSDLVRIAKSSSISYLFIDSYEQHMELLRHYSDLGPTSVRLVLGGRTSSHETTRTQLAELSLTVNELPLDELDDFEVSALVDIIDNVGFWGEHASLTAGQKQRLIADDNHKHLGISLLNIIQAPQMVQRISSLLKDLLNTNSVRDTIFSMAVLAFLDRPLAPSLISELAFNDEIYKSSLRKNTNFRQIFRIDGARISSKSGLFALSLLRHAFPLPYIVDQLLKITETLDKNSSDREKKDLFKSLVRFSVVERIFPEKQRINNLVRYYESLKRRVPWLKDDPHYWLQYAMTQLAYDDLPKTQKYLDQAYALARKRENYHTLHIDTQQSRLFLKVAVQEENANESFKKFYDAIRLLKALPNDVYKFRAAERIKDVYHSSFKKYNAHQQAEFSKACTELLKEVDTFIGQSKVKSRSLVVAQQLRIGVARALESIASSNK